jgi:hypothetical protein
LAALFSASIFMAGYSGDPGASHTGVVLGSIFTTSWLLWLGGVTALTFTAFQRGKIRRIEFHVLGAVIAFLVPLGAVLASIYILPLILPGLSDPSKQKKVVPLIACLMGGLINIPFGVFGGWIVWRLGFPSLARNELTAALASRYWRLVYRLRFALTLLLMPFLAASGTMVGMVLLTNSDELSELLSRVTIVVVLWIFGTAEALAIILAAAFFSALSCFQERVTRGNCLLLGAVVALLLPGICYSVSLGIGWVFGPAAMPASELRDVGLANGVVTFLQMGAMMLLPGIVGGWLLWQVGVAPTPQFAPVEAAASTFD